MPSYPPREKLAFSIKEKSEANLPKILAEPLDIVVDTLTKYGTFTEVNMNLPDLKL